MKTDDKVKEAMDNIKNQLPTARGETVHMLQGQYSALEWVLEDEKEEEKNE